MSVRLFCDSCQKELTKDEMGANLTYYERELSFVKHQKQDQVREIKQMFCEKCKDEIKGTIEGLAFASRGSMEIKEIKK